MNKLKFETNSFGIKRCIINTNSKWCDYSIYESFDNLPDTNSTKVLSVYTRKSDDLCGDNDFVPESFIVDLDFETKELKEKIIAPSNLIFNRVCFFNSSSILINIYKQHLFIYDFILKTKKIVYDKKTSSLTSLNNMIAFTHPESKHKQIINVMQY